ncbi:hypothetical protein Hypma_000854 [Hypsizygus marmoreus]|uniref:Uncharacterized protein n=1 Tax=Hypsizygus marmoreus TaxID=39966 RepID=A0A369J9K2_HYPMA|nr:hypothetical protein Hypma_000854 [Hypsizygus marmoreus]
MASQSTLPAGHPFSHPRFRKRTVSLSSVSSGLSQITLDFPKTEPSVVTVQTRAHTVYGAFTPTASARTSLDTIKRISSRSHTFSFHGLQGPPRRPIYHWDDSPPSSGPSSPTIPSFSRTASSSSILLPPSTLPLTFHGSKELARERTSNANEMNSILAKLERKSKLLTQKVQCQARLVHRSAVSAAFDWDHAHNDCDYDADFQVTKHSTIVYRNSDRKFVPVQDSFEMTSSHVLKSFDCS